jgi:RHS repeat-associated protein
MVLREHSLIILGLLVAPLLLSRATADTASTVGDQGAEGSTAFTGLSQAPEANLFSGSMSMSVPILIPPGRPNATPDLKLVYTSSGTPSAYGLGWDLPLGSIERSTKHGVPSCPSAGGPGNDDEFILNLSGATVVLVYIAADDVYRPRHDEAYIEAQKDTSGNHWVVHDRRGMTFRFGQTAEARVFTGSDVFMSTAGGCSFTAVWALTQVEDPNGNTIDISYCSRGIASDCEFDHTSSVVYPKEILYGANPSAGLTVHPFRVSFTWIARPIPVDTRRRGVAEIVTQVLDMMTVNYRRTPTEGFQFIRFYDLIYDFESSPDPESARVLLERVEASALPSQTFEYTSSDLGLYQPMSPAPEAPGLPADKQFLRRLDPNSGAVRQTVMDMNGDGFIDLVEADTGTSFWRVYYGDGTRLAEDASTWSLGGAPSTQRLRGTQTEGWVLSHTSYDTFDITGDGIPDFVDASTWTEGLKRWTVYPGGCASRTTCGFGSAQSWDAPAKYLETDQRSHSVTPTWIWTIKSLLDVNGDGFLDLVALDTSQAQPEVAPWRVYLGDGSGFSMTPWAGFTATGPTTSVYIPNTGSQTYVWTVDFNGDGLPDRVEFLDGLRAAVDMNGEVVAIGGTGNCIGNWQQGAVATAGALEVRFNDGRGFGEPIHSATTLNSTGFDNALRLTTGTWESSETESIIDMLDVNGDGLPDWVHTKTDPASSPPIKRWWVLLNRGDGRLEPVTIPSYADDFPCTYYEWVRATEQQPWPLPEGTFLPLRRAYSSDGVNRTQTEILDWNGDGLLDHVASGTTSWTVTPTAYEGGLAATRPGLLRVAKNGLGGEAEVRYAPSTEFSNDGPADDGPDLPFVNWVVQAIRRTDGLCEPPPGDPFDPAINTCIGDAEGNGHELQHQIRYEDGLFDSSSREFRGFRLVAVKDSDGNERVIEFSQEDDTRGKTVLEKVFAGDAASGALVRQTVSVWHTRESLGRTQVYLAEQRVDSPPALPELATPPPTSQCLVTRNEPPDDYGRVTRTCSRACDSAPAGQCIPAVLGQVQTDTQWATPHPQSHVYDRPAHVETSYYITGWGNPAPLELVSKDFLYDALELGAVGKGNVTEVRSEIGSSHAGIEGAASVFTSHDPFGNVTSITDPNNHTTQYLFTNAPFTLYPTEVRAPTTGSVDHTSTRDTDLRFGRPWRTTDENGQVAVSTFDPLGRVTCEAGPGDGCPADATVSYAYHYGDPGSELYEDKLSYVEARRTDPNAPAPGWVASRTYADALGRVRLKTAQQVVGAGPGLTTVVSAQTAYDAQGRVLRVYAPYEVQSYAEIAEDVPPAAAHTLYSYLLNGNVGRPDPLGRAHSVTQPDGHTTRTYFEGTRTRVVDPRNAAYQTWSLRDAFGREVGREERNGSNVEMSFTYWYDGLGRLISTRTSGNNSTIVSQDYDMLGRVIARFDPDSGDWYYGYDRAGNLVFQNDPKTEQHLQMCYDALDRLTRRCTFATEDENAAYVPGACSNACAGGSVDSAYSYDEASGGFSRGRLSSVSDQSGTEKFVYDERGRVIENEKLVEGLRAITYFEFDEGDHLLSTEYPDGEVVVNIYGAAGQLVGVEESGGGESVYVSGIEYDKFGRVERVIHGNGVADELGYWAESEGFRLRTLQTGKASAGEYLDLEYSEYDELGKIERIEDNRYSGPRSNEVILEYDALGRLVSADGVAYDEAYAHDAFGNLTQIGLAGLAYDTSRPHQLESLGGGLLTFSHDANGNLRQKQSPTDVLTNSYDRLGRLTSSSFSTSGAWQTQKYDYTGRRVFRQDSTGLTERYFSALFEFDGTNFTKYYFAGERLIAARWVNDPGFGAAGAGPSASAPAPRIPPELPAALAATALLLLLGLGRRERRMGVAINASRALGASLLVVLATPPVSLLSVASARADCDEPLDLTLYHYHPDHLGSAQLLTDGSGAVYAHIRYTPFGRVRGRWDGAGTPIAPGPSGLTREFTGYESDSVTGLQYAGARFYDPVLGQFLTHDPAAQFASPYAYGPGDPINGTDPTGASWKDGLVDAFSFGFTKGGEFDAGYFGQRLIGLATFFGPSLVLGPAGGAIASLGTVGFATSAALQTAAVGYLAYNTAQVARSGDTEGAILAGINTIAAAYGAAQGLNSIHQASESGGEIQVAGRGKRAGKPADEPPHATNPAGAGAGAFEGVRNFADDIAVQRAEAATLAEVERLKLEAMRTGGGTYPDSDQWVWRVFRFRMMPSTRQSALIDSFVSPPIPVAPGTAAAQVPRPWLLSPHNPLDKTDYRGLHQIFRAPSK